MFWSRFFHRTHPKPSPAPAGVQHTCAELDSMPRAFSPLITEMLAMHAHTRHINWLAARETCPDEFRLAARSLINQLLEGWSHQTGGHGTIDDLLLAPRSSDTRDDNAPFGSSTCAVPRPRTAPAPVVVPLRPVPLGPAEPTPARRDDASWPGDIPSGGLPY